MHFSNDFLKRDNTLQKPSESKNINGLLELRLNAVLILILLSFTKVGRNNITKTFNDLLFKKLNCLLDLL